MISQWTYMTSQWDKDSQCTKEHCLDQHAEATCTQHRGFVIRRKVFNNLNLF